MKNTAQFSSQEIDDIIARLEALMIHIKRQSIDDRQAIQDAFPTLSRPIIDQHLTNNPLMPDEMIQQIKTLIQYLIGKMH